MQPPKAKKLSHQVNVDPNPFKIDSSKSWSSPIKWKIEKINNLIPPFLQIFLLSNSASSFSFRVHVSLSFHLHTFTHKFLLFRCMHACIHTLCTAPPYTRTWNQPKYKREKNSTHVLVSFGRD